MPRSYPAESGARSRTWSRQVVRSLTPEHSLFTIWSDGDVALSAQGWED